MTANVPLAHLRLITHLAPCPYDISLSKRTYERQVAYYSLCCRATVVELAFMEFGIHYNEEEAQYYMELL